MSGSAVTPPKGRATRARNDRAARRSINPKVQWAAVIIFAFAVMGAIFYFGRDVKSDYNGAGLTGTPADVHTIVAPSTID